MAMDGMVPNLKINKLAIRRLNITEEGAEMEALVTIPVAQVPYYPH